VKALFIIAASLLCTELSAAVLTVEEGQSIQDAVRRAAPGDTIRVRPGTYRETVFIDKDGITLSGLIEHGRWPVLDGEDTLNDGILAAGHGVIIERLHVRRYKANGIMTQGANNFVIRDNVVEGTSVYGIFPQFGKNGLVARNVVSGVEDAAIYVGMCENVDVLYNETFDSVMGIETENSRDMLVEGNFMHDNAAGMVISLVPGLPVKIAENTVLRNNLIVDNNLDNFAPEGSIASGAPSGVGLMVFGADGNRIEGNVFRNNVSAAMMFADHGSFSTLAPADPAVDPRPDRNQVLDNVLAGNGTAPKDDIGALLAAAGIEHGLDLLSTGKGRGNCVAGRIALREAGTERWRECEPGASTADVASFRLAEPVPSRPLSLQEKGRITYLSVCTGCHTWNARIVGPPMAVIQAMYRGRPEALVEYIKAPVKKWPGYPAMPPQDYMPDEVLAEVARYVLALDPQ